MGNGDALEAMVDYRNELKLEIDNLLVGNPTSKALFDKWSKCKSAMNQVQTEVATKLKDSLDNEPDDLNAEREVVSCERSLKLRQAIKICSESGLVYWLWKLQPGEEKPRNCEVV